MRNFSPFLHQNLKIVLINSYDPIGHAKGAMRFNLPDPVKLKWNIKPEVSLYE